MINGGPGQSMGVLGRPDLRPRWREPAGDPNHELVIAKSKALQTVRETCIDENAVDATRVYDHKVKFT